MFMTPSGLLLLGEPLETLAVRPHRFKTQPGSKEVLGQPEGDHIYLTCDRCGRRECYLCADVWDEECEG